MKIHPAANIFPMMSDAEFSGLVEDIREHGQQEPVYVMPDGAILDGRNRVKACEQLGIAWQFVEENPDDPIDFVLSRNLHRRNLDTEDLAEVALRVKAERAKVGKQHQAEGGRRGKRGQPGKGLVSIPKVIPVNANLEAAREVRVGVSSVQRLERIKNERPDLADKIKRKEMTIGKAYAQIRKPSTRRYTPPGIDTEKGKQHRAKAIRRAEDAADYIQSVVLYCEHASIDIIKSDEALCRRWVDAASKSRTALTRILRQLPNPNKEA
jgi:ParB-like chromosome segregation protein Spo0J